MAHKERVRGMRGCNTAHSARNNLREAGLIRDDIMLVHLQHTPRSIWEITEKGRRWLREQSGSVGT